MDSGLELANDKTAHQILVIPKTEYVSSVWRHYDYDTYWLPTQNLFFINSLILFILASCS